MARQKFGERLPFVDIVTTEFPPYVRGGAGIHVYELTQQLATRTKVAVTLLDRSMPTAKESIPLDRMGIAPQRLSGIEAERLEPAATGWVTHTHSLTAHIAAKRSDRSYVSSVHSLEIDRPWRASRHKGAFERAVADEAEAISKASDVVCVSGAMADSVTQHCGPVRCHVIPPGYDMNTLYHDSKLDALPDVPIDWHQPFILATGRISRQKGYRYLFAAMRHLEKPTTFVLRAGSPESDVDLANFEEMLANAPERHTIIWLRAGLGRRGMRQLYSRAALHISPAIYEPFGLANVEALLCGTPVAATDVGGTAEALSGTPAVLLPDPRDNDEKLARQIAEVIDRIPGDEWLLDAVRSETTRSVLSRASWDRVLPRLMEVYRSSLNRAE
ncbi:glycosyltransferase family 4 protein [Mangrovactinospora gilvigrisea]|uniref:glycosyltransferase family 4 protein n=1 Tax=Mangrovactinospora gilvigrisea TaxID=1428644 RepID=UPI0008FCC4E2